MRQCEPPSLHAVDTLLERAELQGIFTSLTKASCFNRQRLVAECPKSKWLQFVREKRLRMPSASSPSAADVSYRRRKEKYTLRKIRIKRESVHSDSLDLLQKPTKKGQTFLRGSVDSVRLVTLVRRVTVRVN